MEGYAVVRAAFKQEDGWRIGPIFANDSKIARNLYRVMIEKVAARDPNTSIAVDVPHGSGCNPEALDIAMVELSGETEVKLVRLYTKGVPPKMPLQKIFGVTSTELS